MEREAEGSEIYYGAELCKKKFMELLEQHRLPRGLLLPVDLEELRVNRDTGFFWLKQKNRKDSNFRKIGRLLSLAPVITAVVEDRRLRKITVDPALPKITFITPAGLSKTFPVSAFVPDEAEVEQKN